MLGLGCFSDFSLVVASGDYSVVAICEFLIVMASLLQSMGFQVCGLQWLWLPGSRAQAQ